MKEAMSLVLGLMLAAVVAEPNNPWTTSGIWGQQNINFSPSGITVVNPPQFSPQRTSRRGGPMPGYLPLRPVPTPRHPRWFGAETAPKPTYMRPPMNYERFPPYWSDDMMKQQSRSRRPSQQTHRHAKKDCNPCNSVPWIPIFKSPIGLSSEHHPRELVPHVEVYPEPSIQKPTVLAPVVTQALISEIPPTPIIESVQDLTSLPAGNVPVSPELLLPPTQPIPFPELNPLPIAPIHQNNLFQQDQHGLVPPPRSSSNVIVTISEHDHHKNVHSSTDQDSESSSLIDAHAPQNYPHRYLPAPGRGAFDIVKSVPLAEYTSSIEYPFQLIQSPPYIDINSHNNTSAVFQNTYEKLPQTGAQKVSDFLLGVSKDTESKKLSIVDSDSADSKQSSQTSAPETTTTTPKSSRLNGVFRDELDPNILTPPPLPPQLTQLLPTLDTAFLHPLFPVENRGLASVVNGALLPPPLPQPMNPTSLNPPNQTLPPKKIQIIIPYQTINNQDFDQNALAASHHVFNGSVDASNLQNAWPPIVVTEASHNQPRRVPTTQNFQNFKNNWNEGHPSESSQVKHILASNIRDLLKKEMEPKHEQNIRLQKNIDNWTALEYSNHKIVGKKKPGDVITHAQAVTSIPGTSISHLLLPSKKIPDGYFTTTENPDFDEPATTAFPATGVSVNSQPFSTVSRYSTVTRSGVSNPTKLDVHTVNTTPRSVSENEIYEDTTPGLDWSNLKMSIAPGTNEKVYVVTPVTTWLNGKRSTRHIDVTEKYSTETLNTANAIKVTEKPKSETANNVTKLEKVVSPAINPEIKDDKPKSKSKPLFPKSTPLFRVKGNQTRFDKVSKFNKPKPIEKFFATTTKPITQNSSPIGSDTTATTTTATSTTPGPSTAAVFPFRNGGELPLEMTLVNFSSDQLTFRNTGERKTLIKQVKVNNRRGKGGERNIASISIQRTTRTIPESMSTATVTSTQETPTMAVDVLLPHKTNSSKKGDLKKATNIGKKKVHEKPLGEKSAINPGEPNITEDDREDINNLLINKDNETLMAVETTLPRGVFGETRPDNSTRSLLDTIKLLRDFLADTSEERSQEKSEQIGKVIEKIDAKKNDKQPDKETYKYNFPEYLVGELNLSKDELSLVEGAMTELRKNRAKKKIE